VTTAFKTSYPASDTVALNCTLASLASDTNLLAGRESDAVDNRTNLDLDHLLSGSIRVGTSPTASTTIEVWAFAPLKIVSGTPTWPDVFDGSESAETVTSLNVKYAACRPICSITVDSTTGRDYAVPPTSIASLFGGSLPQLWGVFVVHNTGVNLDSTGGNHYLHYQRVQAQGV